MKVNRPLQLERMFLVNSYLYYQMNTNLIEDYKYDEICKELSELLQNGYKPIYTAVNGLDSSGSGFYIRDYPDFIFDLSRQLLKYQGSR